MGSVRSLLDPLTVVVVFALPPILRDVSNSIKLPLNARMWAYLAVRVEQHHEEGKADGSGHQEEPVRGVEGLEGDRGRRLRWDDVRAGEQMINPRQEAE